MFRKGGPTIATSMLVPLLVMGVGYGLLFATLLLMRMRTALNERKVQALQRFGAERWPVPTAAVPAAARPLAVSER